jgi:hypothetical protein
MNNATRKELSRLYDEVDTLKYRVLELEAERNMLILRLAAKYAGSVDDN